MPHDVKRGKYAVKKCGCSKKIIWKGGDVRRSAEREQHILFEARERGSSQEKKKRKAQINPFEGERGNPEEGRRG